MPVTMYLYVVMFSQFRQPCLSILRHCSTACDRDKVLCLISGLELARVPRVPGTRRNSEHHLWHPWILRFLILTGTRRAHSM